MFRIILLKSFLLALIFAFSTNAVANGLVEKSASVNAIAISGLNGADSKFMIAEATLEEKGAMQQLAADTGVGSQGSDQVVERSMSGGCSVGCSQGCSSGCSQGCSMGCR